MKFFNGIKYITLVGTLTLAGLVGSLLPGCSSRDRTQAPPPIENPQDPDDEDPVEETQNLELYEKLADHFGALTSENWAELQDKTISTPYGFTEARQTLTFDSLVPRYTKHDGVIADFLTAQSGTTLYNWQVEFDQGVQSAIDSNDGLMDLVQKEINICGRDFRVVAAQVSSADLNKIAVELMTGKDSAILSGGHTVTLIADGKDYEITVVGVVDNGDGTYSARIGVNGEDLGLVQQGSLSILADGNYIGVLRTDLNTAEVTIGAQKLNIIDSDMNDDLFDSHVCGWGYDGVINWFENMQARIKARRENNTVIVDSLAVKLDAASDIYVPKDGKLSEEVGKAKTLFDITYEGLENWTAARINLPCSQTPLGGYMYQLSFTNKEGITMQFPFISNNNGVLKTGGMPSGTALCNLVMQESGSQTDYKINLADFFVLNGSQDFTHVMYYDSIDRDNRQLKLWDVGAGFFEATYDPETGRANIIRGGETFAVYVDPNSSKLAVDLNADGQFSGSFVELVDYFGTRIPAPSGDGTYMKATITTPADKIESETSDERISLNFNPRGTQNMSVEVGGTGLPPMVEDTYSLRLLTKAGMFLEQSKTAENQQLYLMSPEKQPFTGARLEKIE